MTAAFSIARATRYGSADARVLSAQASLSPRPTDRDGLASVDILIDEGKIAAIGPGLAAHRSDAPRLSLGRRIVLPLFVDAHTHIDKGHIWPRAPNPTGDFDDALATVADDRSRLWSAGDVARRMEFSLRAAYAHGTIGLTHPYRQHRRPDPRELAGFRRGARALARPHRRCRPRRCSPSISPATPSHMADVEAMVAAHGSNILGAATFMSPGLREGLDDPVFPRRAHGAGTSISTSTKAPTCKRARLQSSLKWRSSAGSAARSWSDIAARSPCKAKTRRGARSTSSRGPASASSRCRCAISI